MHAIELLATAVLVTVVGFLLGISVLFSRAQLQSEVEAIRAKGGIVDIPPEWP